MKTLITLTSIVLGALLLGYAVGSVFVEDSQEWDGFSCAINNTTIIHDTGSVTVYIEGREYVVEKEDGTIVRYIFSERPALCIMKRG